MNSGTIDFNVSCNYNCVACAECYQGSLFKGKVEKWYASIEKFLDTTKLAVN